MKTKRIVIISLFLLVGVSVAAGVAVADDDDVGAPLAFYGEADGIEEGTTVVLAVDGEQVDSVQAPEDGVYGTTGLDGVTLSTFEGAGDDGVVTFHIGNADGPEADETQTTDQSDLVEQDLTFDLDEVPESISLEIDGQTDDVTLEEGDEVDVTVTADFVGGGSGDVTDEAELSADPDDIVSIEDGTLTAENTGDTTVTADFGFTDTVDIEVVEEEVDDDVDDDTGTGPGGQAPADAPDDDDVVDDVEDDVVDDVEDDVVDDDDDIIGDVIGDDEVVPDAEDIPEGTPTIEDVRQDLDATEPTTQSTTPIEDADPDRPGVTVAPEETESVSEITFSADDAAGNVDVSEWQDPPESVSQSVSGSVTAAVEAQAEENIQAEASVPVVSDIDPDTDEVRGESATVQKTVDADRLDDPSNGVIAHERGDSWALLETTVAETDDGEVTLEAETESFSLFAVAEVDTEEEPAEEPDDGIGTTGLIGLLVVIALVIAAAVAYRQMNDGGDNNTL